MPVFPASALDYRRLAERRLPRFLFDYIDGGANDELAMARNVADFHAIRLRQRVMRDVSNVDASTTIAGERVAMPLVLAPIGMAGMMARRGECQAVRARTPPACRSRCRPSASARCEEVHAAASRPFWFQLYMMKDRGGGEGASRPRSGPGMRRPRLHRRSRGYRARVGATSATECWPAEPKRLCPGPCRSVRVRAGSTTSGSRASRTASAIWRTASPIPPTSRPSGPGSRQFDPSVTWTDIAWLREQWKGKLIIKGVLEAEDASRAADVGADGLVVSNHGGRQLDSVSSPIAKLRAVAEAVGERLEVYVDGGVRGGIDIVQGPRLRRPRRHDRASVDLGAGGRRGGRAGQLSRRGQARTRSRDGALRRDARRTDQPRA